MLSKEAESHSKCLEGKGRHVHPDPLRHRRALSCWRKGCRPGSCSYRWVGTVLKASSLDRFTPTFCKFKDEKKLNFKAKVSRAAAVFAQHAAVTWHKKWVNCNAYFLKMLCKTQGKVPTPEQESEPGLDLILVSGALQSPKITGSLLPVKSISQTCVTPGLAGQPVPVHHMQVTMLQLLKPFFSFNHCFHHIFLIHCLSRSLCT